MKSDAGLAAARKGREDMILELREQLIETLVAQTKPPWIVEAVLTGASPAPTVPGLCQAIATFATAPGHDTSATYRILCEALRRAWPYESDKELSEATLRGAFWIALEKLSPQVALLLFPAVIVGARAIKE